MKKVTSSYLILISLSLLLMNCSGSTSSKAIEPEPVNPAPEEPDSTAPPLTWQEHWFEHDQLLQRVFYNNQIALYYDSNVDRSISWPESYFSKAWKYVKSVYGDYGDNPRLFVILHTDNYSGGHPSTYLDASHDYRNVLDAAPYTWEEKDPDLGLGMAIHEIGHIVEGATNGIQHNPTWNIWKDSKWAEIFIYDVYRGTGEDQFAKNYFNGMANQYDDFPRDDTQWFADWFYPIYNQYGESAVLNNFYDLLARHFPQNKAGNAFTRRMNWGEFIHFWSGAADKDLKQVAKDAFGWSKGWEYELQQAREKFPELQYPVETPAVNMTNRSLHAVLTVNKENIDGPNGDEGSSKLIDDDSFSKLYIGDYTGDFWAQQEFSESQSINGYMLVSGNDFSGRDPQSWTLKGSNDGESWSTIDTQTGIEFSERNFTKDFQLTDSVSYKYYRLLITQNAGDPDLQLSEWRLVDIE